MYSVLPLTLLLSGFAAKVRCDSQFITPQATVGWRHNPTFDVGDSVNVEWVTDFDQTDLYIYQAYPLATENGDLWYSQLRANTTSTSYIWQAKSDQFDTDVKDGEDVVFFFAIYKPGTNLSSPNHDLAAASSGVVNVTVSNAPESKTTSGITPTVEPSQKPTTSKAESGLSSGAVAGIAVGATLGGIAFLGGLGFLVWRHCLQGDASRRYAPAAPQQPSLVQEHYKPPQAPAYVACQAEDLSPGGQEQLSAGASRV
ncbi:uncharacterized protein BKA55DRAFT_210113 [Fusarium redolens]|uniref:Mid2 domain-containing protein n=1 Tax=Fusarium redolens TaxID=48865 RepID=A0A9P9JRS5_FUSRE|nr:uncharacterized protein BKA55DRAFT_210113 [Fusarium redolens]KAH7228492.1 hypothetical protein BKA55DRAFT_210113 [Fusarium redolens]